MEVGEPANVYPSTSSVTSTILANIEDTSIIVNTSMMSKLGRLFYDTKIMVVMKVLDKKIL
jgi:hypothetical protein